MRIFLLYFLIVFVYGSALYGQQTYIQGVKDRYPVDLNRIWLSHEHILVDFIGANSIQPNIWDHDAVITEVIPYLEELRAYKVDYFVDATPAYLGRDVLLLEKIAKRTGLMIVTNTGLYGARNNKFLPKYVQNTSAEDLAQKWISEFEDGIDGTDIKPGFIKIGIDTADPLDSLQQKLVKAAALTNLKTGLTIASHTGKAVGLWPQLRILKEAGVSPTSFIWVHAQAEEDNNAYLKAAAMGCWISLDGLGWDLEKHLMKLVFAKESGILDHILISHDAGWYDPQKKLQTITPYTDIFTKLLPQLKAKGFTDGEITLLLSVNPAKAFGLEIKD
ncbi:MULTISPECIES: phosphotriesterase [unclassified Arenibacter]|jgi:phosphotriesterase-related protein|uniref:phosphotriesterase family protein n=1 Tax=unclassified Arenibacter TaxID=2615047 RepID=UPI000E355449|nr:MULTISPECIES: phosphotriesterase [unclassified Arenibacter]MCM4164722.1 aryldialkylphosphatase [Arenibacter sp. A80]RFT55795.1 phosphotriesterase [Arenibacter sp. P308M17]